MRLCLDHGRQKAEALAWREAGQQSVEQEGKEAEEETEATELESELKIGLSL